MKKLIFITSVLITPLCHADAYRGIYKCNLHGVVYESTTRCPNDATSISGMNFNTQRMDTRQYTGLRNDANAFEIKERYKRYRNDLKWNNPRNSDQSYVESRLAELDQNERYELSQVRR